MPLDERTVGIVVALSVLVVTAVFLLAVLIAGVRRWRGRPLGRRFEHVLAFLGGLFFGTLYLVAPRDLLVSGPVLVAIAVIAISAWRRRRRRDAGWVLVGGATPWATLWTLYLVSIPANDFDIGETVTGFVVGLVPLLVGLAIVARGDPPPPAPDPKAPPGDPGSRQIGIVGRAIMGSNGIGAFSLQFIAAIVALIASQLLLLIVAAILGLRDQGLLTFILGVVLGSIAATEAWIRSMPPRARKAFEAFAWLGDWELAQLRELTGEGAPTKPGEALAWLTRHPDRPELRFYRVEVLSFARQHDDAIRTAELLPASTPIERFERETTMEFARWMAGQDPDLQPLAEAVDTLPEGSEERLRAEVALAAAEVRRRMADGRAEPGDASEPLIQVRERLGARANGLVGRAYRMRLLPIFIATGLLVGLLNLLFGLPGPGAGAGGS